MNQAVDPQRQPEATPVGHAGTRVEIHERPAWSISGWFGVLVVLAGTAVSILVAESSAATWAIVPILATVVVLTSLVIVQPGQTKVVRFFGSYVGTVRRP
ncbi:MAG: SPFH domain-containing protein, partial [Solirubrobacteraceae bacterium]